MSESPVDIKKLFSTSIPSAIGNDKHTSQTTESGKQAHELGSLPYGHHLKNTPKPVLLTTDRTPAHSVNADLSLVRGQSLHPTTHKGASVPQKDEEVSDEEMATSSKAANEDETSWVSQLQQLGYTSSEILDELSLRNRDGPWIFCPIKTPGNPSLLLNFHRTGCVHDLNYQQHSQQSNQPVDLTDDGFNEEARNQIEQLVGIGGVSVEVDGTPHVLFGSIRFLDDNATAIVHAVSTEVYLNKIVNQLEAAIALQQRVGGCCDSFTFFSKGDSRTAILHRISFRIIPRLREFVDSLKAYPSTLHHERFLRDVFSWAWPEETLNYMAKRFSTQRLFYLAVQFLLLAFASYTRAHYAPLRPYFLDTGLSRIALLGVQGSEQVKGEPFIRAQATDLTCFGNMLNQTVFVFEGCQNESGSYFPAHQKAVKLDILACAEDIVDTWGPGEFVTVKDKPMDLYAIRIGGGSITRVDNDNTVKLHWERNSLLSHVPKTIFDRREKYIIGYMVTANHECKAGPVHQILQTQGIMEEMGTFPGYWEVSERQMGVGLQGGSAAVGIAQINQTWVKVPGRTVKSKILGQKRLFLGVLDSLLGLKLSICTGISRRVPIRQLLADVLASYIDKLMVKPRLWQSLHKDFHIIEVLRSTIDMSLWLTGLDYDHQETFENLVYSVLFLLQDTGVDRHGRRLVVACLRPGLPLACIKIPCYGESYWARVLADSDEGATFAYLTEECLQSDAIKCPGPRSTWSSTTRLLETRVSYNAADIQRTDHGKTNVHPTCTSNSLKHNEAYLLGSLESSLLVTVDRPDERSGPKLLVSANPLPIFLLRRMQARFRPARRLWESRVFDRNTEVVQVLRQP